MQEQLKTVDAETLLSTPMRKTRFLIDTLLPQGVSILSGASKIGKSWLMLWLGLQIAEGKPVWGLPTEKCDVLYLSLEDTAERLKDRLYQLTDEPPDNLYFAITCGLIGGGLEEQIVSFLKEKPQTGLIIIDTLQKVRDSRGSAGKTGMYGNDYDDISSIKRIADTYGIAVILVHHLRKMKDGADPFNEISGSTGIMGAADTSFVLKRNRTEEEAVLLVSGRDVEFREYTLRFDDLVWNLIGCKDGAELHKAEIPPFLFQVEKYMADRTEWSGTATELLSVMNVTDITPNVVTKYLGRFAAEVLEPSNIVYKTKRTGQSRLIFLKKNDGDDANDGRIGI